MIGKWVHAYCAVDEHGQVIDVYASEKRDRAAAIVIHAIDRTLTRPEPVATDKAPSYSIALQAISPERGHITGKLDRRDIERDHQHLTERFHSMRVYQRLRRSQVVCQAHALIRNRPAGFYRLTVPNGDCDLK